MKAIVVIDSSGADIAFYSLDKAFELFIVQRFGTLGYTDRNNEAAAARFDMRSALTAFFVPFSTCVDVMTSMKTPPCSISCEGNLIIVFKKFENNVYIGVGQNGEDSEQLITRRILVFHSVVTFLYGPAVDRMNPEDPDQKAVEWALLNKVLIEYDRLYHKSPSFLLEALEYFHFDFPAESHPLYALCQKLIKEASNYQTNGGIKRIIYSTMLVDSKPVLAPKSSRVKPPDVLLTILVVSALFRNETSVTTEWHQPSTDAYPERRASCEFQPKRSSEVQKDGERTDGGDSSEILQPETPYQTPHGTPGPVDRTTPPPSYADIVAQGGGMDEPEPFAGPVRRVINILAGPDPAVLETAGPVKSGSCEPAVPDAMLVEHLVFIQGRPHMLHCLELYNGIILVLLSELANKEFSIAVSEAVNEMGVIFGGAPQRGLSLKLYDTLETTLRKIIHFGRTEAQVRSSEHLKKLTIYVQKSWDGLKNADIKGYLERLQDGLVDPNSSQAIRIDTQGRDLIDRLIKLFGGVYFSPRQTDYDRNVVREKLLRHFSEFSRDYAGFLVVRAQLSFPVYNFTETYPGLVHFIFIDRSYGDMKMPSIFDEESKCTIQYVDNLAHRGLNCTPGAYLKKKMWKMVEHVQALLEQGYVVQCWKDAEFLYTYHAWVNIPYADIAGPLRYNLPRVQCEAFNIPGIIGTPFYSSMSHGPIHRGVPQNRASVAEGSDCFLYELYCIHEAAVSVLQATKHSRLLVKTLWDTTQEAQIPFH